jgi:hypothetical protein
MNEFQSVKVLLERDTLILSTADAQKLLEFSHKRGHTDLCFTVELLLTLALRTIDEGKIFSGGLLQ